MKSILLIEDTAEILENLLEYLKMDGDDYLVKPFELKTLLAVVKARIQAGSRRLASSPV